MWSVKRASTPSRDRTSPLGMRDCSPADRGTACAAPLLIKEGPTVDKQSMTLPAWKFRRIAAWMGISGHRELADDILARIEDVGDDEDVTLDFTPKDYRHADVLNAETCRTRDTDS